MDGSNILIQSLEWLQNKWEDYLSPFVIVREYEAGVRLRMGKFNSYLKQGANWKLPYPFNEVHKCLKKPETMSVDTTITTSDNKTYQVEVIGEYEIVDARKWILEANDAQSNVKDLLKGFSSDVLCDSSSEDINKRPIKTKIKNKLNEEMSILGARFNKILFGKTAMTTSISLSGASPSQGKTELML